jgi:hypothetical protein
VQGWNPCVGALPHTPSLLHCSNNRYRVLQNLESFQQKNLPVIFELQGDIEV